MSDASQGPGWWQASDGKWYAPELHPQNASAPLPGFGLSQAPQEAVVRQSSTSGLAVASLVLSIVWIGGLGSLLAVIFGFVARSNTKRSHGQLKGDGLALAGIIVGVVGILGSVLIIAGLSIFAHKIEQALTTRYVSLGTTVNVNSFDSSGIRTVTVGPIRYGVAGLPGPTAGREYVAAHVVECAGSGGSQNGPEISAFSLLFPGGQSVFANGVTLHPDLNSFQSIRADSCIGGWLSFEIAKGTHPDAVSYAPFFIINSYEWRLTAH
jgi:hypothetical protein